MQTLKTIAHVVEILLGLAAANALALGGVYVGYRFHDQVGKVIAGVEAAVAWAWSKVKK